jgi:hypothetical protein
MVQRHLTRSANEWESTGRDPGELYRGARLVAALDWAGGHDDLTVAERDFLEASSAAEERELREARRRARRLRTLLAGRGRFCSRSRSSPALSRSYMRGRARHSATVAQAGRLAAESREAAAQQPDLALLLALEAGRRDNSVDSRARLLGALEHGSRVLAWWLQGFDTTVEAVAFSPDRNAARDCQCGGDNVCGTRRRGGLSGCLCDRTGRLGLGRLQPDGERWR